MYALFPFSLLFFFPLLSFSSFSHSFLFSLSPLLSLLSYFLYLFSPRLFSFPLLFSHSLSSILFPFCSSFSLLSFYLSPHLCLSCFLSAGWSNCWMWAREEWDDAFQSNVVPGGSDTVWEISWPGLRCCYVCGGKLESRACFYTALYVLWQTAWSSMQWGDKWPADPFFMEYTLKAVKSCSTSNTAGECFTHLKHQVSWGASVSNFSFRARNSHLFMFPYYYSEVAD